MAKRLARAVLRCVRLLTLFAWRRMLALCGGGADRRRPDGRPVQAIQQAVQATSLTERQAGSVELVRQIQQPVEWSAAPDVANPAPPTGLSAHTARPAHMPAPRVALREEIREVLLRRALAADAPKWPQPSADVLTYYARRSAMRTGTILQVDGLMCIQATLPTAFVRALVN